MKGTRTILLIAALLLGGGVLWSHAVDPEPDEGKKKLVDIKADIMYPIQTGDSSAICLVGNVIFYHNGAVITCDSAVRYSDKRMECFKNVLINKDSTYVYGDRADYNGDLNLAQVYSPLVKVTDGDATLYTYTFRFNTLDNIGEYSGGGVVFQADNVLESQRGYYYADTRDIICVSDVEMRNESYQLSGDSLCYNMDTRIARFFTRSYIWNEKGEILSADRGAYDQANDTYYFTREAYVLSETRELWADTIDYNGTLQNSIMLGNIQINDSDRKSMAFGDYGQYWGLRGETMLTRTPSILNYDEKQNGQDTLFLRADTLFLYVIYPSDYPQTPGAEQEKPAVDPNAHLRFADSLPDTVRIQLADSLAAVIRVLRAEGDSLMQLADSLIRELMPPADSTGDFPAIDSLSPESGFDTVGIPDETIPGETIPGETIGDVPVAGDSDSIRFEEPVSEIEAEDPTRMGPARQLPDTVPASVPISELAQRVVSKAFSDSVSMPDSLSVPVSLPDSLKKIVSQVLSDSVPPVIDTIDLSQLREQLDEPEGLPEIPDYIIDIQSRGRALLARVDSLSKAERYIRPTPPDIRPVSDSLTSDSIARDSLVRDTLVRDSLSVVEDTLKNLSKKELKRLEKQARAERKAKLRAEKRAAREARLRERLAKRGIIYGPVPADTTALKDSLQLDSIPSVMDSLEAIRPLPEPTQTDTVERIVRGFRNVKIYRGDMQAVGDSIVGFSTDSTLHLYINPVLWSGENQIKSDVMDIYTKGEEIDRAEFIGAPIMCSKLDSTHFNQVAGKTMTAYFHNSEVYRNDVDGNAQALYYLQEDDDPELMGFLVLICADISFLFEDQFVAYIIARGNPDSKIYPMDKIPSSQPQTLPMFSWEIERKPSRSDVFDRTIRPSQRETYLRKPKPRFLISKRINHRREWLTKQKLWVDRNDVLTPETLEFIERLKADASQP